MNKNAKIAMIVIVAFVAVTIIGTAVLVGSIGNGLNEMAKEYEEKHQVEISGNITYADENVTYMISTYPSFDMAKAGNTFVFITYTVKNIGTDRIDISASSIKPVYKGVAYDCDLTLSKYQMENGTCYKSGGYTILPGGQVTFTLVYEMPSAVATSPTFEMAWTGHSSYKVTFK